MSFTPTVGQVAAVKLTMGAGLPDWVGAGINWKLDIDGKVVDKSNFRDGRIKNGTLPDATLTLTLVYDQNDSPLKPGASSLGAGVLINVTGTAKCFVDATHYFSVPVIVSNIGVENPGVEDDLMLDVTFGANGAIVNPAGV